MSILALAALAFAPAIFWLWFFLKRNAYRPESRRLLAATFFLGMLSTIPAGLIHGLLLDETLLDAGITEIGVITVAMLLIVGPAEETSKFLAVRLYAYRSLYFDEPMKGLVYATAASLGFASLENLLYVLEFGPLVMIGRAPLSTVAHVIFGAFWGYALGMQKQSGGSRGVVVFAGLACAALVHGLFNVTVLTFPLAAVAIVAVGLWWVLTRYRWARSISPFRLRRNYPKFQCPACGWHISVTSRFCDHCGSRAARRGGSLFCSHCGHPNRADAGFCTTCGDRLQVAGHKLGSAGQAHAVSYEGVAGLLFPS